MAGGGFVHVQVKDGPPTFAQDCPPSPKRRRSSSTLSLFDFNCEELIDMEDVDAALRALGILVGKRKSLRQHLLQRFTDVCPLQCLMKEVAQVNFLERFVGRIRKRSRATYRTVALRNIATVYGNAQQRTALQKLRASQPPLEHMYFECARCCRRFFFYTDFVRHSQTPLCRDLQGQVITLAG